jgi:hypothetical protein
VTARPQDVELLAQIDQHIRWRQSSVPRTPSIAELREWHAALASAQAREEELRAEVAEATRNWHECGRQMDAFADALQKVSPWSESNDMLWIDEVGTGLHFLVERATAAEARAERLAEALRDGLSGLSGLFASGDYPLTDEVVELGLAIIEDMQAALTTNAAQPGETGNG